jgi:hypothetical protein
MAFHPHTNDQTEVVNRGLVHTLCNSFINNNQCDSYLHILQHSYNRETHSSTGFSPLQVYLRFQPLTPTELSLNLTLSRSVHHQKDQQKTQHFIQNLAQHQKQVTELLQDVQEQAKQRHDKHITTLHFQPRDNVWLQMEKKRLKGWHHKLHQ